MINNLQNLFLKYKNKITEEKSLKENIISSLKEYIPISTINISVNTKTKEVKFINLKSSYRFILKNKEGEIMNKIYKEFNYKINI
jgi:hypothetical protein